jgi:tRNA modification GTPase
LRETRDEVEAEGIRRGIASAAAADLVLVLDDGEQDQDELPPAGHIRVATKADLRPNAGSRTINVSALSGFGMDELRDRLAEEVKRLVAVSGPPPLTRARHRAGLTAALGALDAALDASLPELRGEALRQALRGVGRVTGHVGAEAVLDAVFGHFCIGK